MTVAMMSETDASNLSKAAPAAKGAPKPSEARRGQRRLLRIRKAILRGDYENALKLSIAGDRLFERIMHDGRSR
jgi:hypothetical protein